MLLFDKLSKSSIFGNSPLSCCHGVKQVLVKYLEAVSSQVLSMWWFGLFLQKCIKSVVYIMRERGQKIHTLSSSVF